MDLLPATRQATAANSKAAGDEVEKSSKPATLKACHASDNSDLGKKSVVPSDSPSMPNLTSIDGSLQIGSLTPVAGGTPANGKSRTATYIPPVESREHNTRSKNGVRKEVNQKPASHRESYDDSTSIEWLDEVADQLARLDSAAYQREQIRDSNSVLSELVIPMSMPWTHGTEQYRVMAHDIDELEGVIGYEDELPGEDRIGHPGETTNWSLPEKHVVAARRSSHDPGIIEFRRFLTPKYVNLSAEPAKTGHSDISPVSEADPVTPFSFLEEIQLRKRRRVNIFESNSDHIDVSIRFGGSSSRASLISNCALAGEPLCLLATLPQEVQSGRRVDAILAVELANELGSYDHRHGLPRQIDPTKRVRSGRTRIAWSTKYSLSQKTLYKSLLTGASLENGQQRRPSEVKVYIKVGGCTLTQKLGQTKKTRIAESDERDKLAGGEYTSQAIDTALNTDPSFDTYRVAPPENLQCSFDSTAYLESIWRKTSPTSQCLTRLRSAYSVTVVEKDRLCLSVRPPQLCSHPCEDGTFHVTCSKPGELLGVQYVQSDCAGGLHSKAYPWATAVLLDAMAKRHQACSICWSEGGSSEDKSLLICSSCSVQVHPNCYDEKKLFDPQWCCESCVNYQERKHLMPASLTARDVRWARVCTFCPHYGSAVARHSIGQQKSWMHLYCRTWYEAGAFEQGTCIICSGTSRFLIRCAASGCSLLFHPMCAKIISHAASSCQASNRRAFMLMAPQVVQPEDDRDAFLSTQYCEEVIKVSFSNRNDGKRNIPVAYCGLHNPKRARDRYGLLPCALHFKESVRLPRKRSHDTS